MQKAYVGVLRDRPHENAVRQVGKLCEALLRFAASQAWFAPFFHKRVDVSLADVLKERDWRATPSWPTQPVREWKGTPETAV